MKILSLFSALLLVSGTVFSEPTVPDRWFLIQEAPGGDYVFKPDGNGFLLNLKRNNNPARAAATLVANINTKMPSQDKLLFSCRGRNANPIKLTLILSYRNGKKVTAPFGPAFSISGTGWKNYTLSLDTDFKLGDALYEIRQLKFVANITAAPALRRLPGSSSENGERRDQTGLLSGRGRCDRLLLHPSRSEAGRRNRRSRETARHTAVCRLRNCGSGHRRPSPRHIAQSPGGGTSGTEKTGQLRHNPSSGKTPLESGVLRDLPGPQAPQRRKRSAEVCGRQSGGDSGPGGKGTGDLFHVHAGNGTDPGSGSVRPLFPSGAFASLREGPLSAGAGTTSGERRLDRGSRRGELRPFRNPSRGWTSHGEHLQRPLRRPGRAGILL